MRPETGATFDGVPLSLNRPPAIDLEPWIARMMAAVAPAPDEQISAGLLCNDAGYVRTVIQADWTADTAGGTVHLRDETCLFGQHTKAMPIQVTGGIRVAGFMLRPGAIGAIFGVEDGSLTDRIKPVASVGIEDRSLTGLHDPDMTPEEWLQAMENWLRDMIARRGCKQPDPVSQKFELATFADPNQSINAFARAQSLTPRTLQRIVKRDFGLTPKQVMKRARTLDLAARICGVADEDEEDIYLRYFDQSHQIREFTALFRMTPRQFMAERQNLLTLNLEVRQARRLEVLNRLAPDALRPWMRDECKPSTMRGKSSRTAN